MNNGTAWLAPAKINLFLRITGRRTDGMHTLQTAFQFIDLADQLTFKITSDRQIKRLHAIAGVRDDQDLCVRAAQALQQYAAADCGVEITLHKQIPMAAGLGGASSDAATTLRVLNQLWQVGLDIEQLCALGLGLGADVPVFIRGQAAWAEGVGEQLTALAKLPEYYYLIVNPQVNVSTAQMFADSQLTRNCHTLTICHPEPGAFGNVFEPIARAKHAIIDAIFNCLEPYCRPFLTGSGGCVVAAFSDQASAIAMQANCPSGVHSIVAKSMNASPLNAQLLDAD